MTPFLSGISQLLCLVCGCSEVGKVLRAGGLSLINFSKPCFSIVEDIHDSLFRLLWNFFPLSGWPTLCHLTVHVLGAPHV